MSIKIALAGNPNCGKTTMFNELTGSYQYVGNWPGVTVEKKEGKLKGRRDIVVMDLPGIYSLSPYTLEEVITRDYLLDDKPDVIINIVDASNIERNLYLTTQLTELGIPVVVALNMMDIIEKNGDKIDQQKLARELGCEIVATSAVTGKGVPDVIKRAIQMAEQHKKTVPQHTFSKEVEKTLGQIQDLFVRDTKFQENPRYFSIKFLERDEKILKRFQLQKEQREKLEQLTVDLEKEMDDDTESIVTCERYDYIGEVISKTLKKGRREGMSTSDKIDRIVTNKWLALPIFFGIMWLVYFVSITTVGDLTIGWVEEFFGWLQGIVGDGLASVGAAEWAQSLLVDGIIGSIGAIFTFVPQLMILFFFLSLLEDSGYMARVAFIMDRIFRKFGLSGKSFIPMLIGTGCSIPGIMASRTIENERDRKMTIMLTPFIPCGAKLPVFAMFVSMMFMNSPWVGPSMYLIGILAVIICGLFLKRTKLFKGDPAPFVMELPNYKAPRLKGVAIHMWEKGKSFIIKAGTIIFAACAVLWVLQNFNFTEGYVGPDRIDESILAGFGNAVKWIFIPLGFGDTWAAPVASISGLVAKEVVVATFTSIGSVIPIVFTQVTAYAFMVFTLFAAPCFAAIGAMRREFGSMKWTIGTVAFQTGLAYVLAMLVNLIGSAALAGTPATQPRPLDIGMMEEASEAAVINGDIVLIVFAVILAVALVIGLTAYISRKRRYKKVAGGHTAK